MSKTVIEANKSLFSLNLKELLDYKDLFYTLAQRDFKIKYAQTLLGFFWAFVKPAITLFIFTLIFGKGLRVDTEGIPYILFAVCGLSAWTYFAAVMAQSGGSIIGAQAMVRKIYFPRLIIPLSKALVGLVDFLIMLCFITALLVIYQYVPSKNIVFLPLFICVIIVSALGVGIWLSALTIRYRDFQHIIPFLVQIGIYITPVAYPSSMIIGRLPEWASFVYYLNPMAGVVEGVRWCILGGTPPHALAYVSFAVVLLLFISSLFYFKRVESLIADIV